jgi:hypothetical protein
MIPRSIQNIVTKTLLESDKIIIILGPRQAGKTTLIDEIQKNLPCQKDKILKLNCDVEEDFSVVNTTSLQNLENLLRNKSFLIIDEVQRLSNPGLTLKIIHDNFKFIKLLVTGSSSFEIKNKMSDALTGRYYDFTLLPFSYSEINQFGDRTLESILTYGEYPEVFLENKPDYKKAQLAKIVESFLFKDILSYSRIRSSEALINLARAVAFQIGSELNENELSSRVKIDRKTLLSYLDILEKSFVIKRLHPYSQNPRREIGRRYKVYFVDLGIRNQLIGQFGPLSIREDYGRLWENFLVIERFKKLSSGLTTTPSYFWRNLNGSEVDYLEIVDGNVKGYEFKLNTAKKIKFPKTFTETYHNTPELINPENFNKFVI